MTDAKALFTDTNILIYANVSSSPFHEKARQCFRRRHKQTAPCGSVAK